MEKIIWQPTHLYQPHFDFAILLDRKFVAEMLNSKISSQAQRRMNQIGSENVKRFRMHESEPYIFYEDTALVHQINFDAGRGTWLAMDNLRWEISHLSEEKPIRYTTHNMDTNFDTLGLLSLFDCWINYSEVLRKK